MRSSFPVLPFTAVQDQRVKREAIVLFFLSARSRLTDKVPALHKSTLVRRKFQHDCVKSVNKPCISPRHRRECTTYVRSAGVGAINGDRHRSRVNERHVQRGFLRLDSKPIGAQKVSSWERGSPYLPRPRVYLYKRNAHRHPWKYVFAQIFNFVPNLLPTSIQSVSIGK